MTVSILRRTFVGAAMAASVALAGSALAAEKKSHSFQMATGWGGGPLMPVTSCNLSEPEVLAVGGQAAQGHIASSVYFQSKDRAENQAFVSRFKARYGTDKVTSADAEASYIAVILLARAIHAAQSTEIDMYARGVGGGSTGVTHQLTEAAQGTYHYTIGPYSEPVLHIQPGDRVVVETQDAFEGKITKESDVPSDILEMPWLNPQCGPIMP